MPQLYEAAARRVASLSRFASRIDRDIPAALPQARVWLSGSGVTAMDRTDDAAGILDAWTPLGPGNIGGRTRVVRFHPTVPTTLFAAGVSGGIWKSDDNGTTWRPTGDGLINIAVNALAIDPLRPDVMYAGTGEGYFREEIRGTGLPLRGSGVFITTNGGQTWQQLPATISPDFHWVNDLELGVNDKRRIYAATRTGVWRSTDGGATWARLLEVNVRGGCLDLALRPDRSEDVLFASCGSYEQATVYRFPRAAERSDSEVVLREPDMGRTSVAIAASNPDVMYALAASNVDGPNGIYRQGLLAVYRSDRGGLAGSWETRVNNSDPTFLNTLILTNTASAASRVCNPQAAPVTPTTMGWYNNVLAVDPRDPNRVWAAGVDWFRSDDGGRNWGLASWGGTGASYAHVDQHGIAFHPQYDGDSNQIALIGNDGGIFRTRNARAATSNGERAACTGGAPSRSRGRRSTAAMASRSSTTARRCRTARSISPARRTTAPSSAPTRSVPTAGARSSAAMAASARCTPCRRARGSWNFSGRISAAPRTAATRSPPRAGLDPIVSDVLGPDGNYLFIVPFTHDPIAQSNLAGRPLPYRGPQFGCHGKKSVRRRCPMGGASAPLLSRRAIRRS